MNYEHRACFFGWGCAILLSFNVVDRAMEWVFAHIREVFEEILGMDFCIEDTRKKPHPGLKGLIKDKIITLEQAKDWLRTIYEIRFFEEKVFDLLGQNIIKGASHLYAG